MAHALPCHVGDVQQAVDTAQVHECTVVGQVLDDTLQDGAFLQLVHQLLALFRVLALDNCTTRHDHVVTLAVQLDELEFQLLAFQVGRVAHRAHIDQRTGQECADILDVHGETTLDLAADAAGDGFVLFQRFFQLVPHHGALCLLARQDGFAEAVFDGVQCNLHLVAHAHIDFASVVTELFDRHDAFGLQAGVDHDHVAADINDGTDNDGTGLQLGQVGLTGFKQFCK